jgi:hypothetical protein
VEELAYEIDPARSSAIRAAYLAATRRCLVWFVTRDESAQRLCRAVYHIYLKLRGEDVDRANTNYAGGGRYVPSRDIARVEFLE